MKYLIDECLSPELATLARDQGYPESTHVSWLGLAGQPLNTVDFRPLYGREDIHVGLVAFNAPPRVMNRLLQKALFLQAMAELGADEAYNTALEITVDGEGVVTIERYPLPR